jgi:hypothetical protein
VEIGDKYMIHKIRYLEHIPIHCKRHPFRKYRCKEFYPISDEDYWKCHLEANKKVKEVYGIEGFNKLRYYFLNTIHLRQWEEIHQQGSYKYRSCFHQN